MTSGNSGPALIFIKFKLLKTLQGQCWKQAGFRSFPSTRPWAGARSKSVSMYVNLVGRGVTFANPTLFCKQIFRYVAWHVVGIKSVLYWKATMQVLTLPLKSCSQPPQVTDSAATYTETFKKGTCAPSDCPSSSGQRVPGMDAEIGQLGLLAGFNLLIPRHWAAASVQSGMLKQAKRCIIHLLAPKYYFKTLCSAQINGHTTVTHYYPITRQ